LALASGVPARGQEIRAANGVIVKGQVLRATDAGLEIQMQTGPRTLSWETLSAATRYRWQTAYRANYDAVLDGLPPSARTNPPDEDTSVKPALEPATDQSAVTTTTATVVKVMLLFDQARYEPVHPLSVGQFPGLQLRAPKLASFIGLQYGPGKDEVVYLGFDTKGPDDLFDLLNIYSPRIPAYTTPLKVTGDKKVVASMKSVTFKMFKLTSQFGQVTADFDVDCADAGALDSKASLSVSATLSKDDTESRFLLTGDAGCFVQSNGEINAIGILDLPLLWLSRDLTSGQPALIGNLKMGQVKMVPREGMDNRVNIVITSDRGDVVQREAIKLDKASAEQRYAIACPLGRVTPGQSYTVQASIDLGPFFGTTLFEDKITLPGAPPP
jgi:hypothetical protein